jgi:hypothetical protein
MKNIRKSCKIPKIFIFENKVAGGEMQLDNIVNYMYHIFQFISQEYLFIEKRCFPCNDTMKNFTIYSIISLCLNFFSPTAKPTCYIYEIYSGNWKLKNTFVHSLEQWFFAYFLPISEIRKKKTCYTVFTLTHLPEAWDK